MYVTLLTATVTFVWNSSSCRVGHTKRGFLLSTTTNQSKHSNKKPAPAWKQAVCRGQRGVKVVEWRESQLAMASSSAEGEIRRSDGDYPPFKLGRPRFDQVCSWSLNAIIAWLCHYHLSPHTQSLAASDHQLLIVLALVTECVWFTVCMCRYHVYRHKYSFFVLQLMLQHDVME